MYLNSELKKLDVLIIEDEADICFLLSNILKKRGLQTSYVNSLSTARKILTQQNPDVLFLDNHLPDGFGIDFISSVKAISPHTKIIMISAHDTVEDRNKALNNGADYFVGKPFTSVMVNNTVDALLQTIIQ